MKIRDIGGEFKLIERLARPAKNADVLCGIGDDAAVVRTAEGMQVITTDMLVEGDHFSLGYFSPRQIGIKAMESNVSDIAAMGGEPRYALISLALTEDIEVEMVDGIYEGIYQVADRYGFDVIGGDTTHGARMVINVTLIGTAQEDRLCLRSHARPGDRIFVSGPLGGSTAGLMLFLKKIPGFEAVKKHHTEPSARMDISRIVAPFAHAMEDVSDGLASEVKNICRASGCGAVLVAEQIPILDEVRKAAQAVSADALDFALFGGEDFQLVYTVSEEYAEKAPGTLVGEIREGEGVFLRTAGKETLIERSGYDHFAGT
ncbi:MAG: thiamine-phosphate kinase [Candidatus Latescibacterota bacterium]